MNLSKINEGSIQITCEEQQMPSWSAFDTVITKEQVPERIVGFLPILPFPVTRYDTVYTALKNFQNVLSQLTQNHLAVTCDERVYRIAREILLLHENELKNLTWCPGSFPLLKVYLGCIGKYLRGSGAENIWIENEIFSPNTTEAVLGGSHYVRSLKGMILLSETMERLQWKAFFDECGVEEYAESLNLLQDLKHEVASKNRPSSRALLDSFISSPDTLLKDFEKFREGKRQKSETFMFWDGFVEMVRLAKDLVRADREGDWDLHLKTVEAVLPYFASFDSNNYLHWCSLYLEDMKRLPKNAPKIHEKF